MWLKNDGFYMAELFLAISAWLIAASVLFPLTVLLIGQSVQLNQEANAVELLYDRLQQLKFQPNISINGQIEKAGTIYTITSNQQGSMMEVCVEFDGFLKEEAAKCVVAE